MSNIEKYKQIKKQHLIKTASINYRMHQNDLDKEAGFFSKVVKMVSAPIRKRRLDKKINNKIEEQTQRYLEALKRQKDLNNQYIKNPIAVGNSASFKNNNRNIEHNLNHSLHNINKLQNRRKKVFGIF